MIFLHCVPFPTGIDGTDSDIVLDLTSLNAELPFENILLNIILSRKNILCIFTTILFFICLEPSLIKKIITLSSIYPSLDVQNKFIIHFYTIT